MRIGTIKRLLSLLFAAWLLLSNASAEEITLRQRMENDLTEVYGYTVEELEDFVFETREDGSVACWPKEHPGWVYTVFSNGPYRADSSDPFFTGYLGFCGENAVRDLLREMREKHWISLWSEETKAALLDACLEENVRISTDLYLSESAAQALQAFFESCYGPTAGWTDALWELRDSVFTEYSLTPEEMPFHVPGVRSFSRRRTYQKEALRAYTYFDGGAYPDELKEAFSDPHLSGWACHSGALMYDEMEEKPGKGTGKGLAAFEKDGKRQLTQLSCLDGEWTIHPLGANALYPTGDYRVTFDTQQNAFAVQYVSDEESLRRFDEYGIRYAYRDSQGRPYVDGIYFQSSFYTIMTDDGWTGFESGRNYSGYGWTLLLTEDGEWEYATSGY